MPPRKQIGNVAVSGDFRRQGVATKLLSALFDAAAEEGNQESAEAAYKAAVKSVDRAVSKGLLHKNNAARKKSQMALKMNALGK